MIIDVNKYKCYAFESKKADGTKVPTVVAISTYAGQTVKGYAKLNPADEFNWEKGRDLAIARCAQKIATKRANRAAQKLAEAQNTLDAVAARVADMVNYFNDSVADTAACQSYIAELLEKM